ncbi:hypothetical protein J4480_02820 [Candidatus Woesearchaeota archaeon]|nr:hypothetical protein [Candidatus Woesearchaeota archaeon]
MSALSIILFFLYSWGFGFGLGLIARESEDFLERNLMRIGTGLGAMLAFGLLLNLIRIPLDWRVFLSISILLVLTKTYRDFKKERIIFDVKKISISIFPLLVLALFSISFYMYEKGAFAYPYLEDDDSWSHAMGVKYVSIEKTVFAGAGNSFYMDPYPPNYDMLMGILHQTNNSVYWTLKFFNALIVSLSIVFFYFFAKTFTNSSKKALFATFALFAVPAYLSHFIWAIALTMPLFFASFYAVEKIKDDKRWFIAAAIVIAATLTSSPTHSAYFGLFFLIYLIGRALAQKKFLVYEFLAGFSGLLLSFLLWWLPMILTHSLKGTINSFLGAQSIVNIAGTGDRIYNLSDFIFAKKVNMINNPIGIGIVLSILTVIGLIFIIIKYKDMLREDNYSKIIMMLWFIFAFYAVNAARFPIKLSPFRAWILLAIPVSLLSGESIALIDSFAKSAVSNIAKPKIAIKAASLLVLGLIAYSIIMTSFVQKYTVNTAIWPPGGFWTSNEEIQGYMWLKDNIPSGTRVFTFSNNALILGLDKFICHWCSNVRDYQRTGFNESAGAINSWMGGNGYNYLVVDGQTARIHGSNETNNKISELLNSGLFSPMHNTGGFILLKTV